MPSNSDPLRPADRVAHQRGQAVHPRLWSLRPEVRRLGHVRPLHFLSVIAWLTLLACVATPASRGRRPSRPSMSCARVSRRAVSCPAAARAGSTTARSRRCASASSAATASATSTTRASSPALERVCRSRLLCRCCRCGLARKGAVERSLFRFLFSARCTDCDPADAASRSHPARRGGPGERRSSRSIADLVATRPPRLRPLRPIHVNPSTPVLSTS